ncbi:HNH endonuclease [Ureibacillus sp. Re31]|uniref:HNH endonuclease n=2 Tax=Ureibacillus galli TaxID=2762222 RepID=A0ABR8XFZ5_9BACL|nr:HNH endonuclease [Ureibacillus galli]
MKMNGSFDSTISLEKLYRKANGKCYICNCQCDYNDYKVDGDSFIVGETYPTIEHVIPLSKGGSHSWDNVKLACWKCNTLKGDKEVACGI